MPETPKRSGERLVRGKPKPPERDAMHQYLGQEAARLLSVYRRVKKMRGWPPRGQKQGVQAVKAAALDLLYNTGAGIPDLAIQRDAWWRGFGTAGLDAAVAGPDRGLRGTGEQRKSFGGQCRDHRQGGPAQSPGTLGSETRDAASERNPGCRLMKGKRIVLDYHDRVGQFS